MQAKDYLRKAERINNFIKAKEEQLEILRAKASGLGGSDASEDKIQSSPNLTRIEDSIISMMQCEEIIENSIQELRDLYIEITDKINALEDDNLKLVLMLRYLNLKEWEFIAVEMSFSYSHTLYLHRQALEAFQAIHNDFLESQKDSRK